MALLLLVSGYFLKIVNVDSFLGKLPEIKNVSTDLISVLKIVMVCGIYLFFGKHSFLFVNLLQGYVFEAGKQHAFFFSLRAQK